MTTHTTPGAAVLYGDMTTLTVPGTPALNGDESDRNKLALSLGCHQFRPLIANVHILSGACCMDFAIAAKSVLSL
jgi:hypothetical protein